MENYSVEKMSDGTRNLIFRIPLQQKSYDAINNEIGTVDNLIGVNVGNKEFYISQLCDLGYKGTQQEGTPYLVFDTLEDLEEVCKLANLQIWSRSK